MGKPYVYGARVHDKAKAAALRELVQRYRGAFETLRSGWVREFYETEPELTSKQVHDRARTQAVRDLVELNRAEYEELRRTHVAHFRSTLQLGVLTSS